MLVLTQAKVRRLLCYNPLSGNFMWRVSPPHRPIQPGDIAGGINYTKGNRPYLYIKIRGSRYLGHRLAFLYMCGHQPSEIDHKDGNGLNNRWLNLRECTHIQNCANQGPKCNNKLSLKGVHRHVGGKYMARVKNANGTRVYLGLYNTPKAAADACRKAAKDYFGEFAFC